MIKSNMGEVEIRKESLDILSDIIENIKNRIKEDLFYARV